MATTKKNDLSQINNTEKIIASFSKEAMNQIKVLGVKIFGTQASFLTEGLPK